MHLELAGAGEPRRVALGRAPRGPWRRTSRHTRASRAACAPNAVGRLGGPQAHVGTAPGCGRRRVFRRPLRSAASSADSYGQPRGRTRQRRGRPSNSPYELEPERLPQGRAGWASCQPPSGAAIRTTRRPIQPVGHPSTPAPAPLPSVLAGGWASSSFAPGQPASLGRARRRNRRQPLRLTHVLARASERLVERLPDVPGRRGGARSWPAHQPSAVIRLGAVHPPRALSTATAGLEPPHPHRPCSRAARAFQPVM